SHRFNMNSSVLQLCFNKSFAEFPKEPFGVTSNYIDAFIAIVVIFILYNYMAIICDDYFLPSIEKCAKILKLSEDVAGATIMAAGSSAAEFFINIIGAIVGNFDIGLGTVVGSGMINSVVVIGLCGLLSREALTVSINFKYTI
ncbi:sodium/potassium/calcium exchanger 3-like protein, partial [Leptotrombidium deliense]